MRIRWFLFIWSIILITIFWSIAEAKANNLPVTYSLGFPLKTNWWQIQGFSFGGFNSAFNGYHLAEDTLVSRTPVGTAVYSPCTGQVMISDNISFTGYGSDSSASPNYRGYVLVIACQLETGTEFTVLLGHLQSGSTNYNYENQSGSTHSNIL